MLKSRKKWLALILAGMALGCTFEKNSVNNGYEQPMVDLILVEGGSFKMGDESGEGKSDERPAHLVKVDDFYISKYEITQAQYYEVMGRNPSYFKGQQRPVENVTWFEAVDFCNRLSLREGKEPCYQIDSLNVRCDFSKNGYRLPTEAEWEFAARGGVNSRGFKFSGSDSVDQVAWNWFNSSRQTHEVGLKFPNELGIYDMSGNVGEWCWDWYDAEYYSKSPANNPRGPETGYWRVIRGGGYPSDVRVVNRIHENPSARFIYYGFRIVSNR
ncbi:formylglycine-generating enzyme family protein [Calditrichota bacterium LG25]